MNRYNDNSNDNSSNFNDNFDNQDSYHHRRRSPSNFRGSGGGGGGEGGHRPFNSPPRQHHSSAGAGGGFRPIGGGGGGGGGGGFRPMAGGFEANYPPPQPHPPLQTHMGQKRAFPFSGRGGSSANSERFGGAGSGGKFAKLFVGSVPRTAAEKDIRHLFEEHGDVIEVALIKDKKTGQPQGCCFIKYATLEEADRAIRALHNQHTLPGGAGPIQVRYADGERERLGAIEYKLFVGSLNKQATEIDVQEIFSRFGRVEDVYLMRDELKQSRGCGFVKYSDREMALAAIDALNGVYTMRGCDQPLTVRFADPKRPRQAAGDLRGGAPFSRGVASAFGGPGFGPRFQAPGPKPAPNFGDAMGDCVPPTAWRPMSPQNMGPTSNPGIRSMGSQVLPRSGDPSIPLNPGGPFGGPSDGSLPGIGVSSSSTSQQGFNQPSSQVPTGGQQISPLQKHLQSPKHLPSSFQLHPLAAMSYSQTQTAQVGQLQVPVPAIHTPFSQALPSHLVGLSGQLPASQPQAQQNALSAAALQNPLNVSLPPNLQPNSAPVTANQQQFPVPIQQKLLQPLKQSPSQLAQMLSQQTQTLQASFQTSQQAFSQLQQQLHLIQPSNQNMTLQQNSQASKQQWAGMTQQSVGSTPANAPGTDVPSSVSNPAAPIMTPAVASVECHWTEHTSPDGFKYYHNSLTRESKWEKPEELILFEQQQQQQKPPVQQPQTQSHPAQQASQQVQLQNRFQTQIQHPPQLQQQPLFPTLYPASGVRNQQNTQELGYRQLPVAPSSNDPTRFQQELEIGS